MKQPRHKFRMKPRGKTTIEQWYVLARKWCSVLENRTKEHDRCKKCFSMRYYFSRANCFQAPSQGCDGCSEMESFYDEAENFFKSVEKKQNADTPIIDK